jgi:hypothetical protein
MTLIPVSMAAAAKPESNSSSTGKTTQMVTTAGEQTTGEQIPGSMPGLQPCNVTTWVVAKWRRLGRWWRRMGSSRLLTLQQRMTQVS